MRNIGEWLRRLFRGPTADTVGAGPQKPGPAPISAEAATSPADPDGEQVLDALYERQAERLPWGEEYDRLHEALEEFAALIPSGVDAYSAKEKLLAALLGAVKVENRRFYSAGFRDGATAVRMGVKP